MSSDDSMNNGVGFEQLDSLSASADGGIPIEYDDELFSQFIDFPEDHLESFQPQITEPAIEDGSSPADTAIELDHAPYPDLYSTDQIHHHSSLVSAGSGLPLSAGDVSHPLPNQYWRSPSQAIDVHTSSAQEFWDTSQGVQDPPAELSTEATLDLSFWSSYRNNFEEQNMHSAKAIVPVTQPTTNGYDEIGIIDHPQIMSSAMSRITPLEDDAFSKNESNQFQMISPYVPDCRPSHSDNLLTRNCQTQRQMESTKKSRKSRKTGKMPRNIPASHFHTFDLNDPKSEAASVAEKRKTMEVRRIGACHRCRMLHRTCGPGTPCISCQGLNTSSYRLGCDRTKIADLNYFELFNFAFRHDKSIHEDLGSAMSIDRRIMVHFTVLDEFTDFIRSSPYRESTIEARFQHFLRRLMFCTHRVCLSWRKTPALDKHPSVIERDLSDKLWLDPGSRDGSVYGAEFLQRIDRAVESFRKNRLSFKDGVDLLCRIYAVVHHTDYFLIVCTQLVNNEKSNNDSSHIDKVERFAEMIRHLQLIIVYYRHFILKRLISVRIVEPSHPHMRLNLAIERVDISGLSSDILEEGFVKELVQNA